METLQIKKDDAIKAYQNAKSSGKKLLENLLGKKVFLKDVTERIKTIEDVLEDNYITMDEIEKMFENAPGHFKYQFIAELLCKSLNEYWVPNWDDSKEYKYFPWFKMGSSGFQFEGVDVWFTPSAVSHLCFKSRDLAVYAGNQFTDLYKNFMIIN